MSDKQQLITLACDGDTGEQSPVSPKRCSKCGTVKLRLDFSRYTRAKDGLDFWCKVCRKMWHKSPRGRLSAQKGGYKYRVALRKEFLEAYGGICVCCKESEPRFLTLEHINHDGKQHREACNNQLLIDLRKKGWPKAGYTILCYNCNLSTKYGEPCPHVKN